MEEVKDFKGKMMNLKKKMIIKGWKYDYIF